MPGRPAGLAAREVAPLAAGAELGTEQGMGSPGTRCPLDMWTSVTGQGGAVGTEARTALAQAEERPH